MNKTFINLHDANEKKIERHNNLHTEHTEALRYIKR